MDVVELLRIFRGRVSSFFTQPDSGVEQSGTAESERERARAVSAKADVGGLLASLSLRCSKVVAFFYAVFYLFLQYELFFLGVIER